MGDEGLWLTGPEVSFSFLFSGSNKKAVKAYISTFLCFLTNTMKLPFIFPNSYLRVEYKLYRDIYIYIKLGMINSYLRVVLNISCIEICV
jgi:hypothetical protein